jgi:hypothetical protein
MCADLPDCNFPSARMESDFDFSEKKSEINPDKFTIPPRNCSQSATAFSPVREFLALAKSASKYNSKHGCGVSSNLLSKRREYSLDI